ncbi:MAG: Polyketide cyclase / dehydrase and lipid transport [Actinomycetota bacterium]|nr:Polyketide cyclase / dehydrase and lipid transport [Actinomycetota bacterium]
MSRFRSTIQLPVPPEEAWAFVVEHGSEIEPLKFEPQGPQAVGTLNHLSGRVLGLPIKGISRTVVWNPPAQCVFESVKPSWPIRTVITEDFVSTAIGTEHLIRYEVTPRGVVGRVVAPVVCALMKRSRRHYQARLRAALAAPGRS